MKKNKTINFTKFSIATKNSLKHLLFLLIAIILFSGVYKEKYLYSDLIKVAYFCSSIKNGGVERVMSLLINYISQEKLFCHYLITKQAKLKGEYPIPKAIHRISLSEERISLFQAIKNNKIDILIYNFYNISEIKQLNKLKGTKIIYYDHSCFLIWIYQNIYYFNKTVYHEYKKCNYVISLIPLENDYLFKKWGIKSILMDNPITFEYDSIIPSQLNNNNIIMIGRANDGIKRYELGIIAMKNIIKEIPQCEMNIISFPERKFETLIKNLNLDKNVRFVGYQKKIAIYLKNSSLHILPSLCECYPMVLSEAKIFGIPSIIVGLDYLALAKGGTVIIYDDSPFTIAKEAINILKNDTYRKRLGKEARKSMKKRKNAIIAKKWSKLLLSIYKGRELSDLKLINGQRTMSIKEADNILKNQLKLLQKRRPQFKKITLENFKTFSLL